VSAQDKKLTLVFVFVIGIRWAFSEVAIWFNGSFQDYATKRNLFKVKTADSVCTKLVTC